MQIYNRCVQKVDLPGLSRKIKLKEGKFYDIKISHIEDGPAKFSVQLLEHLPYLDNMMKKINSKSQELLPLLLPICGTMCLGPQQSYPVGRLGRVVLTSPGDISAKVTF